MISRCLYHVLKVLVIFLLCLDGKKFVAILSYVYSDELNDRTREQTKKIVKCIQEKMEDMDYKFYDSHKDFEQGCK